MALVNTSIKELYIVFDDNGKMTGASATPLITTTYPDGEVRKDLGSQVPLRTFEGEVVNTGLPEERIGSLAKVVKALNLQATVRLDTVQTENERLEAELQVTKDNLGAAKGSLESAENINERLRAIVLDYEAKSKATDAQIADLQAKLFAAATEESPS